MWKLFCAVALVESGGDPLVRNGREDAVGIVQIRRCVVVDVNRFVVGGNRCGQRRTPFTLADRYDPQRSYRIFAAYLGHYGKGLTPEQQARVWNGGPLGHRKRSTEAYGKRVMRRYYEGCHHQGARGR